MSAETPAASLKLILVQFKSPFLKQVKENLVNSHGQNIAHLDYVRKTRGFRDLGFKFQRKGHRDFAFSLNANELNLPLDELSLLARTQDHFRESFYVSLDRVYVDKPLSIMARETLLGLQTISWVNTLRKIAGENPPQVFFPTTPHFHWDIAMAAALDFLGWETWCFRQSHRDGFIFIESLEGGLPSSSSRLTPPPSVEKNFDEPPRFSDLDRIRKNRQKTSDFDGWLSPQKRGRFLASLRQLAGSIWRVSRPSDVPYWDFSFLTRLRLVFRWSRRIRALRKWLAMNGWLPDFDERFAYFALHFQPERSTTPEAKEYWFQYRAILKLAMALDEGVTLYVKEHPRQIGSKSPDFRQLLFRTKDFYRLIDAIPGVKLLRPGQSSKTLIEKAMVIATCSGSAALDAADLGRPTIFFGTPWYRNFGFIDGNLLDIEVLRDTIRVQTKADSREITSGRSKLVKGEDKLLWPGVQEGASASIVDATVQLKAAELANGLADHFLRPPTTL